MQILRGKEAFSSRKREKEQAHWEKAIGLVTNGKTLER